ncbi:MAG: hypothetical protein P8X57_03320 [Cyclobacteriaceae bacterium]
MKIIIASFLVIFAMHAMAQENESTSLVEMTYLLPKMGHSSELEAALTAHNEKFHSGDNNSATIRYVSYGEMTGYYVWIMFSTYATLDNRPDDDNHTEDWSENVESHLDQYGPTRLWQQMGLSTSSSENSMNDGMGVNSWNVYLKPGQGYRFRSIMEKMKEAQASINRTMLIMSNAVGSMNEPNFMMIWPFKNYAEWDEDRNIAAAYREIHGDGSWVTFLDEWREIVEGLESEVRTKL